MEIPRKTWNRYIKLLRNINDTAALALERWVFDVFGDGLIDVDTRDKDGNNIIDYAYMITAEYGNASAAVSAEIVEAMAELAGVAIPPAELAPNPTYGEVAKTVQGVLKTSQNREEITSAVGRLVKQTGARTTRMNARRDNAQFAWVPSGDTCAFCIALASRGWQNARKADHKDHIHSNCDCAYAIRYSPRENIAGYNPDEYYQEYKDADGGTPNEKINAMRRKYYAENREEILAQKADAYAKRQELNSSQAVETDIN